MIIFSINKDFLLDLFLKMNNVKILAIQYILRIAIL